MGAPTAAELPIRRRAAVAFLAYAYLAAAYRESPAASGLHTVFVRWYIANRSLFPADSVLQSMERARNQRLTSELGYNAISGYALGVALESAGARASEVFTAVWRVPPPNTAAELPGWLESRGFFAAAESVTGIDTLDARLRVSMDPTRVPEAANVLIAEFINIGGIPTVPQPVPGVTPGEIRAMEYEGTPEGAKGSSSAITPTGSSTSTSLTTASSSMPSWFRTAGPAQVAVGVVGVGVVGYVLYLVAKRVKK